RAAPGGRLPQPGGAGAVAPHRGRGPGTGGRGGQRMTAPLVASALPLPLLRRGKVREVYEVDGEALLLVASDRVSAFDRVMRGLVESARVEPAIFSPATKAEAGHDENVTFDRMAQVLGKALAERLKRASLALYEAGRAYADPRGIIIADTKFEFGTTSEGTLLV